MLTQARRSLSILTLLALFALLVVACAPVAPAPAGETAGLLKVRMGTQPWIGYGPWWIADAKGFFAEAGIEAEFIDFVTDSEVNAAFAAGEMDVANIATHTAMKLFANGVNLRAVLIEDASNDADAILAGGGISSPADLAGKAVAYEEGSTSDLLLHAALQDNGLTLDDITAVPMPAADAGSALIAGQVEVAVTYEPYISAALAQNSELQMIYSGSDKPGLISDVLVVSTPFAEANPETMKRLAEVWDRAVTFLRDNPGEGRAIIAEAVGSSADELATAFDGVRFYNRAENAQELGSGGGMAQMAELIGATAVSMGLLEDAPDFQQLFSAEYLAP